MGGDITSFCPSGQKNPAGVRGLITNDSGGAISAKGELPIE